MTNKMYLTQEGYDKLTVQLLELKSKGNRLITQIEEVAQPDESCEDGLATQLKEELEVVNDNIDKIESALEMSEIINGSKSLTNSIQVGSKVKIKISGKTEKEFHIVSELEADPSQNKISDQSPLGLALLGKSLNDEVMVQAPVGKLTYKIVSIY
jgi:transcription elongation factor GreA